MYHKFLAVSTTTGCTELPIHPIPCPHLHQHNIPPIYMPISTQTSILLACSSMLPNLSAICLHLSVYIATQVFYLHTLGNRLLLCKLLPSLIFQSSVLNIQKKKGIFMTIASFALRLLDSLFVSLLFTQSTYLTFRWPCIVIHSYNKTN